MTHYRETFLRQYCDNCIKPANEPGCGINFKQIFEPIKCPAVLSETHNICQYCLDLVSTKMRHEQFCLFAKLGLRLHACGWATPASTYVLKSLKQNRSPYVQPVQNLISELFTEFKSQDTIIVPIPLGKKTAWENWKNLLQKAVFTIKGAEIMPLISRNKLSSTRKSVAQIRARIANQEYEILASATELISGKRVVLVDDNVTTGHTMIRCAEMLLSYNPESVFLLALDRSISARILQRCPVPDLLKCEFKIPIGLNN